MNDFNVLSLFDGISCGQIALNRAGIKYDNYFASEIESNAIKVTSANYPSTIQLGDVTKIKGNVLPKIKLLIGGSPCQGFSTAGKGLNFEDPRSKLFFEYVRLLKECNPDYFLLENVRMKQEYQDIISEYLGVKPILINSSLVSAQNRVRLYWTNIPNVTIPIDKNIKLKDVIKQDYDGIWVWPRGANPGGVQSYRGKSPSITTSSWQHNFLIYQGAAQRGRYSSKEGVLTEQVIESRKDEKANALLTVQKNSLLKIEGFINKNGQGNRVYSVEGKSSCLNATSGGVAGNGNSLILQHEKVRKFTPVEAERLQTVPDNYTNCISDNQRFKCLGNGWTVDVIAHILSFIPR